MLCTIGWQQSRCWEGTLTGLALHKQSQAGQSGTLCQKRGIGLLQGDFNLLVELQAIGSDLNFQQLLDLFYSALQ